MDIEKPFPPQAPVYRKRRIWASIVLTIFGAGLAPIYCGYLKIGIWLEVVSFVAVCLAFVIVGMIPSMATLLIVLPICILFFLAIFIFNIRLTIISNRVEKPRINRVWWWIMGVFFVSNAVDYVTRSAINIGVIDEFDIPSTAMEPTLLKGDFIIASMDLTRGKIERGDIIIFKYPRDPNQMYIKRLVGIGGDTIRIEDKQVFRNGDKLNEPYVIHIDSQIIPPSEKLTWGLQLRDNMPETAVPQGQYFVMGDNRDNSQDSRFFGFVDQDLVVGKPRFIYLSWDADANLIRSERIGKRLD